MNAQILLHLIVFLPLAAAIAVLLGAPARKTSLAAAVGSLIFTVLAVLAYDRSKGGFQLQSFVRVMDTVDLKYFLGVDGLSLAMTLLATIVTVSAVWVTPKIEQQENLFYACLLFISAGAIGAFLSLDLFFFYIFHELALIPTFLLIGIWGSGEKQLAAWKITIYLALGSMILLVGLIGLYLAVPEPLRTFDIPQLYHLSGTGQIFAKKWVFPTILIGFGTLISLFPFHTWAPQAYASMPAPGAMLHAGVLKKFGLYGLLRVAMPLMPAGIQSWDFLILLLLIGNILFVGLATISQKQLDTMLGYSSVMHMGYIFLGLTSVNSTGVNGAALMMFAHGLSIAALFALSGIIREKTGTLELADLGGLGKKAPLLMFAFGLATFASIGLPGFANFASEMMVFFGAFSTGRGIAAFNFHQIATIVALWGVVISAVYMLRAYRAVFMGDRLPRWDGVVDMPQTAKIPLILLMGSSLVLGFYPQLYLQLVSPALQSILSIRP